jgi:hypothetical protein
MPILKDGVENRFSNETMTLLYRISPDSITIKWTVFTLAGLTVYDPVRSTSIKQIAEVSLGTKKRVYIT